MFFFSKTNRGLVRITFLVLGELGNDPAERTVPSVDPMNLNQIILAEGKNSLNTTSQYKPESKTRILAEATIFIVLSIVLKDVLPPIFEMPQGGAITIAGLVPLLWFALRRGPKYGMLAGFTYGLIHAILPGAYIINPLQGFLDYPLAFTALGLAGFIKKVPIAGIALGIVGRFLCSFTAGIIFFTTLNFDGVIASAIYNGVYLIPEFIITTIVIYILLKRKILYIYM